MMTVVIADTTQGLKEALEKVFAPFGGVRGALPPQLRDKGLDAQSVIRRSEKHAGVELVGQI